MAGELRRVWRDLPAQQNSSISPPLDVLDGSAGIVPSRSGLFRVADGHANRHGRDYLRLAESLAGSFRETALPASGGVRVLFWTCLFDTASGGARRDCLAGNFNDHSASGKRETAPGWDDAFIDYVEAASRSRAPRPGWNLVHRKAQLEIHRGDCSGRVDSADHLDSPRSPLAHKIWRFERTSFGLDSRCAIQRFQFCFSRMRSKHDLHLDSRYCRNSARPGTWRVLSLAESRSAHRLGGVQCHHPAGIRIYHLSLVV